MLGRAAPALIAQAVAASQLDYLTPSRDHTLWEGEIDREIGLGDIRGRKGPGYRIDYSWVWVGAG